jgi:hypothetical protein
VSPAALTRRLLGASFGAQLVAAGTIANLGGEDTAHGSHGIIRGGTQDHVITMILGQHLLSYPITGLVDE